MQKFLSELEKPVAESLLEGDCPLEHVRLLVIDEVGLMYEELFAPLLEVLTTCGKLSQVVVSGDHRQLMQIQPGQLQKDLFYGFEQWLLHFEHCHRFDDETAVIFRHNAMAIDAMRPDLIIWKPGVFERIYMPYRHGALGRHEYHLLENDLARQFEEIGFGDTEACMGMTRTHEIKELMMRAMERVQYGNVMQSVLRVGQKIMTKYTNNDCNITSKRVLILEAIEDCPVPTGWAIKWMDEPMYQLLTAEFTTATDTSARKGKRGYARRLRCRAVGSKQVVYLPYEGKYVGMVERAGAVTISACQGKECDHALVVAMSFWDMADIKEAVYMTATRQRKRFTVYCTESTWNQWCKNPAKARNSLLGKRLRVLAEKFSRVYSRPPMSAALLALKQEEGDKFTPVARR